jgi:hypothetical protein
MPYESYSYEGLKHHSSTSADNETAQQRFREAPDCLRRTLASPPGSVHRKQRCTRPTPFPILSSPPCAPLFRLLPDSCAKYMPCSSEPSPGKIPFSVAMAHQAPHATPPLLPDPCGTRGHSGTACDQDTGSRSPRQSQATGSGSRSDTPSEPHQDCSPVQFVVEWYATWSGGKEGARCAARPFPPPPWDQPFDLQDLSRHEAPPSGQCP